MPESDVVSRLLAAIDERGKAAAKIHDERCGLVLGTISGNVNDECDCGIPGDLLRLCQSHRDIVALHGEVPVAPGRSETTCVECGSVKGWPCPTLVLVARGYGVEDGED